MLLNLHVRNLALIEEEEISFTDGLNILTGETGAGKSILLGSVNLALGAKTTGAVIRTGAESALIEMIFRLDNSHQREKLAAMDLSPDEDDCVLIKRKIFPSRSVCSIQGETVTQAQLREMAQLLIDVYGQRENHKLLRREAQLGLIDDYAGDEAAQLLKNTREAYHTLRTLTAEYENTNLDAAQRQREADLLSYEVNEIEQAQLQAGEDTALEAKYRRLSNFRRIHEAASAAGSLSLDEDETAAAQIERALRALSQVQGLDSKLDEIAAQLSDIDGLLSDFSRSLNDYMDSLSFDPEDFAATEERLNLINHLKAKYGGSLEKIGLALAQRKERLSDLEDYEGTRKRLLAKMETARGLYRTLCAELTLLRKKSAEDFAVKLKAELRELNFPQVDFQVQILSGEEYAGADGCDCLRFYISMNPGEKPRPLDEIASGGELSRIMLAVKTVFAGKDDIHTFIFDEIDSGISGQTAWKVSEKLAKLSRDHQILCITHLPQIAAMGDAHLRIVKETGDGRTRTHIRRLDPQESLTEVARLLGSDTITKAALDNAVQLKETAELAKDRLRRT